MSKPRVVTIDNMTPHPTVTLDRIVALVESQVTSLDDPGICINCGEGTDGVEPDARRYPCPSCRQDRVYGAEELLARMAP